jgi:DNA-binding CsgD family transcriptional regulator
VARESLEALTADDFAGLPWDSLCLASLAILAETAVTIRARDVAVSLFGALEPYAARNLIQGVPVGWGAAAWYLARLAALTGDFAAAAEHAALARRLHARWGVVGLPDPLPQSSDIARHAWLTRREIQVLTEVAFGRSNAEVAAALTVSVHTVERHLANIFVKVGARNRTEATAWAHRQGLTS